MGSTLRKMKALIPTRKMKGLLLGAAVAIGIGQRAQAYDAQYTVLTTNTPQHYSFWGGTIEMPNGLFYTVLSANPYGDGENGAVASFDKSGSVTLVHEFSFTGEWEAQPSLFGHGNILYGVYTDYGSPTTTDNGGYYKIDTSNNTYTRIFGLSNTNGTYATYAPYTEDDTNLYVTAPMGGKFGSGSVLLLSNGVQVANAYFRNTNGSYPSSILMRRAKDGYLYGTTLQGGLYSAGTIYRLNPTNMSNSSIVAVHSFTNGPDGYGPYDMIMDGNGVFYGSVSSNNIGRTTVWSWNPDTGEFKNLWVSPTRIYPGKVLKLGFAPDGSLAVSTFRGDVNNRGFFGLLTLNGTMTKAYSFPTNWYDNDITDVVLGSDNQFYGTHQDNTPGETNEIFRLTVPMPGAAQNMDFSTNGATISFYTYSNEWYILRYNTNLVALTNGTPNQITFQATGDTTAVVNPAFPIDPATFYWVFPTNESNYNQAAIRQSPKIPWLTTQTIQPGALFLSEPVQVCTNCSSTNGITPPSP